MVDTHTPYDGKVMKDYYPNAYVVYEVVKGKKVQENRYEYNRLVLQRRYKDNGKYDGVDYVYKGDGTIQDEVIFKDGKEDIIKKYDEGKISSTIHFKDGKQEVVYKFAKDGCLEQICILGECDYYSVGEKVVTNFDNDINTIHNGIYAEIV